MTRNKWSVVAAAASSVVVGLWSAAAARADLAAQPYASFWFPSAVPSGSNAAASSILNWDPTTDPDAAFNVGRVPLATRYVPGQVNTTGNVVAGVGVQSLVSFGGTSGNPSQGSATADYYAPTYWQYTSQLVFFGGSAGEGSILAPNGPVIDAAHRNGVPVLGNVFLGPNAYGGNIAQVNALLTETPTGDFPVADKMIQAAKFYGFDGWFINQETTGGNATTATQMQAFIKYLHAKAPGILVEYYDAMNDTGAVGYQNALTTTNQNFLQQNGTPGAANKVADGMFLNYSWNAGNGSLISSSNTLATKIGVNPLNLYTGIDVESSGYNRSVNWNYIFPTTTSARTSIGVFYPQSNLSNATGSGNTLLNNFLANEGKFWVGSTNDPSNTTGYSYGSGSTGWHGLANYVQAQAVVTAAPFVTNFSTGEGTQYAINGTVVSTAQWNNLGLQDVQPTWRWLVTSAGTKLTPSLDFSNPYYGGASLNVSGNTNVANTIALYATQIPVAGNTNFRIAYDTGMAGAATNLAVALTFADGSIAALPVANTTSAGWNTAVLSLAAYAGKTLAGIGLQVDSANVPLTNYAVNVGQLAVYNGAVSTPAAATGLVQTGGGVTNSTAGTVRLQWTPSTSGAYAYNVYQQTGTNTSTWVGGTPDNAYFVQNVTRQGTSDFVTLAVQTVANDFGTSALATKAVYVDWPRSAETLAWQADGATAGGSGTWNTTTAATWAAPAAPADQFWSNSWNDTAVFAGTAGTVTVAAPVAAAGLTFNTDGYAVVGTNPITLAGTAPAVTVAAGATATISAPVAGTAGLTKAGLGTLVLTAANPYAGTTTVSAGTLTAANVAALGTGPVLLAGGTLSLAAQRSAQTITGFAGFALKGTASAVPTSTGTTVTLTDGNGNEAGAAFTAYPVPVTAGGGFTASFTYLASAGADGVAFVVQNDPRGTAALGGNGGGLGYGSANGGTPVANGGAVLFNIYSTGAGTAFGTNGTVPGSFLPTSPVNIATSGNPIAVQLVYNAAGQSLTETLTDPVAAATYTHTYTGVNFASLLGSSSGYVGFTGATGGVSSTQSISNFSFTNNVPLPTGVANAVIAQSGTTSTLNLATSAAAASMSVGSLTVNSDATVRLTTTGPTAVLVTPQLNLAGTLDVGTVALDLPGVSLSAVSGQAAAGVLYSSAAAADPNQLTAVGVIANDDGTGTPLYTAARPFLGTAPGTGDVLVRTTYFGDANLDGVVNGADYARIDAGFLSNGALTGWYNGDFNYDGKVDASDYTLIDNAFNLQSAASVITPTEIDASVTAEVAAVPEPATAMASVAAAGCTLIGRGRRLRRPQ